LDTSELKAIVESLVFVSDVPLRPERIAEALDLERGRVMQILRELEAEYRQARRGFVLDEVAGGFQFRTRAEHADWVRRLNKSRPFRFSRAALETLAIVAYRQPITRAEIEYLRGVDSGGVLKTLLDRLPPPSRSGVVKVNTPAAASGSAIHSRYGRKRPQRVRVRSAIAPMMGSAMASQTRVTPNMVPATAGEIPNTSV
jgi:segregation and condensation protein B